MFGPLIKRLRQNAQPRKVTLAELEKRTGILNPQLSRWEKERSPLTNRETTLLILTRGFEMKQEEAENVLQNYLVERAENELSPEAKLLRSLSGFQEIQDIIHSTSPTLIKEKSLPKHLKTIIQKLSQTTSLVFVPVYTTISDGIESNMEKLIDYRILPHKLFEGRVFIAPATQSANYTSETSIQKDDELMIESCHHATTDGFYIISKDSSQEKLCIAEYTHKTWEQIKPTKDIRVLGKILSISRNIAESK